MSTTNNLFSEEQKQVSDHLIYKIDKSCTMSPWHFQYRPFTYRIGGYAGTGKTYLLCQLRKQLFQKFGDFPCAFVSFTGKAASVLEQKLKDVDANYPSDFVGTIHSLIYIPITKYDEDLKQYVITGWGKKRDIDFNIIFIDEASMVTHDIWEDLKSYGITLIAVGDHGQLPPIGDQFGLLQKCDYYLHKIHRQVQASPIIPLAHYVRKGGYIPVNKMYSPEVFKLSWNGGQCRTIFENTISDYKENLIVLCGMNKTRNYINKIIREKNGYTQPEPYPLERLVCLKNNHETKIMNGQIGTANWFMPEEKDIYRMTIQFDGQKHPYEGMFHTCCLGKEKYNIYDVQVTKRYKRLRDKMRSRGYEIDFFDFGYAISVHKSQGSEWDRVILIEERSYYWDDKFYRRWLYTAVTRAKSKLFIIQDF